jgi:hypothetical protein
LAPPVASAALRRAPGELATCPLLHVFQQPLPLAPRAALEPSFQPVLIPAVRNAATATPAAPQPVETGIRARWTASFPTRVVLTSVAIRRCG